MLTEDLRELSGNQPYEPDLDAVIRRGRQLRRRRAALVSGGTAAAAAVVAIVLVAGAGQGGAPARKAATATGNGPSTTGGQVAELTARITSAMGTARASETDRMTAVTPSGTTENIVTRSGIEMETTWNPGGVKQRVVFEQNFQAGRHPSEYILDIDYANHTATTRIVRLDAPSARSGPLPRTTIIPDAYLPGSPGTRLAGTAQVNGQPAYKFTIPGTHGFNSTVWVSKASYLPLKEVAHQGANTYQYSWSFTPGSAPAKPAIPPGFKHK
jgi:hypothetical protein